MSKTAVVILNFNGSNHLRQFLPSVVANTHDADIIIADNGSTDDSVDYVKNHFPNIQLIQVGSNLGFCGGYNYVLQQIKATYYVLLNSDIEVTADWLTPLIELLDTQPTVAAVQPKILSYHQKNKFEYAGAAGGFVDVLGYPFCRGRLFDHLEEDHGQYNNVRPVFWASGACLAVRSKCFHEVGGFNERFFAHMEEIDLCWKLHRLGHQIFFNWKSTIYHLGGGTLNTSNTRKTYLNFRNGLSILFCHTPLRKLIWKIPIRLMLDFAASIYFLITGSGKHTFSVWKAMARFCLHINKEWKERSAVQQQIQSYHVSSQLNQSVVWEYYIRKKKTFGSLIKK